jgi:hypothetical protein
MGIDGPGGIGDGAGRAPGPMIAGDESLAEVLASIRALVSAEAAARRPDEPAADDVLMLTPEMRVEPVPVSRSGEVLAEGIDPPPPRGPGAPILDEEALRHVVNQIVREELQGELGDRISRNLRKLIRREIGQMLEDRREDGRGSG